MTGPAVRELPCGCLEGAQGHVAPWVDLELSLFHGERDPDQGDPEPIEVPGTAIGYIGPAVYCLCGHPDYLTCPRRAEVFFLQLRPPGDA